MMKLLLPVILLLLGVGGGVGAGIVLAPSTDASGVEETEDASTGSESEDESAQPEMAVEETPMSATSASTDGAVEYLNMSNQFIIPLVDGGNVNGIVVITISLEVVEGTIASVNLKEPKIRDRFLQVLFNHANNGGFDGNFTDFRYLKSLKDELLRNAKVVTDKNVTDVLILDLVRQDQ
jgi:hypothetical protein